MKNFTSNTSRRESGISLFETLTVIAILGIIASLSMPLLGGTQAIRQATAKRNAQTFCTLAYAADAAGLNYSSGTTDVEEVMKRFTQGITITKGTLKGREFRLPNLTKEEIKESSAFLHLDDGKLAFGPGVLGEKAL